MGFACLPARTLSPFVCLFPEVSFEIRRSDLARSVRLTICLIIKEWGFCTSSVAGITAMTNLKTLKFQFNSMKGTKTSTLHFFSDDIFIVFLFILNKKGIKMKKKITEVRLTHHYIPGDSNRPSSRPFLRHSPRGGKKKRGMSMNMPNEPPCLPIKSVFAPPAPSNHDTQAKKKAA